MLELQFQLVSGKDSHRTYDHLTPIKPLAPCLEFVGLDSLKKENNGEKTILLFVSFIRIGSLMYINKETNAIPSRDFTPNRVRLPTDR